MSEGESWRLQRKALTPAFHFENLKSMVDIMIDVAFKQISIWTDKIKTSENGVIQEEIRETMSGVTLEVIGGSAFGSSVAMDKDNGEDRKKIYSAFYDALALTASRMVNITSLIPIINILPLPSLRHIKTCNRVISTLARKIIADRRAGKTQPLCQGRDILDLLLETKDPITFTESQIMDESLTFVLAGHETTSNLLSWSMYMMTTHADIYQKLQNEVDTVLGKKTVDFEAVKNMPYLDAFFCETLRFWPPIPFLGRYAIKEHTIGKGDKEIKIMKGTEIRLSTYNLHRQSQYYKDPLKFSPERFLDHSTRPPPFSYLPFGSGPRSCLGQQFALLEAKVVLSSFLQHFTFKFIEEQKIAPLVSLTLRPKYGIKLALSLRQRS